MTSKGYIMFAGASGARYHFHVWPLGTRFRALGAVCLLSKRDYRNHDFAQTASHELLHIGQMSDLSRLDYGAPCFDHANCICVYAASSEEHRQFVEDDLADALSTWNVRFRVDLESVRKSNAPPEEAAVVSHAGDDSPAAPA